MQTGVVPIRYGFLAELPNKPEYPNSNLCKVGGCVIGTDHIAKVWYCPECRKVDPAYDRDAPELKWQPSEAMQLRDQYCGYLDKEKVDYRNVYVYADGTCLLDMIGSQTTDLSALRQLPVKCLQLDGAQVHDLSGLQGIPLEELDLESCPVTNIQPVCSKRLSDLRFTGTPVRALTPLRACPLGHIEFSSDRADELLDILREKEPYWINGAADDFWVVHDMGMLVGKYDAASLVRIDRCEVSREDGDELYDATFVVLDVIFGGDRGEPILRHEDMVREWGAPKPGESFLVFFDEYEQNGENRLHPEYLRRVEVTEPAPNWPPVAP